MSGQRPTPWTGFARNATGVALVVGFAFLVLAYASANRQETLEGTITALNIGVLGVVISGTAELFLVVGARRRVSVLRDAVVDRYGSVMSAPVIGPLVSVVSIGLVTVPGSTWSHRVDCPLVAGKEATPVGVDVRVERCVVCEGS